MMRSFSAGPPTIRVHDTAAAGGQGVRSQGRRLVRTAYGRKMSSAIAPCGRLIVRKTRTATFCFGFSRKENHGERTAERKYPSSALGQPEAMLGIDASHG